MPDFLETPRFPFALALNGFSGGPGFSTGIVEMASGDEQRNAQWAQARREWSGDHIPWVRAQIAQLLDFCHCMQGRAVGFRFRDPLDYRDDGRGILGAGVGAGLPTYQLGKRYAVGTLQHDRAIRKPVPGTITIKRNGAAVAVGSVAGQVTLDTATGIATFGAEASGSVASATPGTTTVIGLGAAMGLSVGQLIYLNGLVGTLGDALNGRAWPITAVSGASYTIAVNSTGLTGGGGGSAYRYPQPTDALTWVGEFDVPVRFASDRFSYAPSGRDIWQFTGLGLIELRK